MRDLKHLNYFENLLQVAMSMEPVFGADRRMDTQSPRFSSGSGTFSQV